MMIVIEGFDHCLEYVVRLGFTVKPGLPGWIPASQKLSCDTADLLLEASGQRTWYHEVFHPFRVHYRRKENIFYVLDTSDIFKRVNPVKKTVDYITVDDLDILIEVM